MVSIFGRQPSPNIIDRRSVRTGGLLAAIAGLFGAVGSAGAGIGFVGIDATMCLLGIGDCEFSISRLSVPGQSNLPGGGVNNPDCIPVETGSGEAVAAVPVECAAPGGGLSPYQKERLKRLVGVILGDAERIWGAEFAERGEVFRPATLVLYDQDQDTACGPLPAGAGPTYCKKDERIYIDFAFFELAVSRYGAQGDTIPAFIVAHEVSHHVQNLRGDFDRYLAALAAVKALGEDEMNPEDTPNQLLVRFELQADCLAGVSAARAQTEYELFDSEDIDEAIRGATRLGDDHIQLVESGFINEAGFTHGSGAQRLRWLERGFFSGDIEQCNTWTQPFDEL